MRPAAPSGERWGAAIRHEWTLDPASLIVNHGSFGATPRIVFAAQNDWRAQLERHPTRFMARTLPEALRRAATHLAAFVGAKGDDVVFVENATVGCNAVLRSLHLEPGDEILVTDHGYRAVRNAAAHVADERGARLVEATIPFPLADTGTVLEAVAARLTRRTRLAIFDHITSPTALVLPVERLAALCRDAGVPVLIDGAHGPGQVTLDLPWINADWYVGNCHKWLSAPKGCAFLWARKEARADLHPVTISHGYGKGFTAEFDWTGTRDPSAFLAVTTAIDFHAAIGGAALRERDVALADEAATLIARRLNTDVSAPPALRAAMASIRLPLSGPATVERALALRAQLLDAHDCDAPIHAFAGALWLRLSAAPYNEMADYERLATVIAALLREAR